MRRLSIFLNLAFVGLLGAAPALGSEPTTVEPDVASTATTDYWAGYQSPAVFPSALDRVVVDVGTIGLTREKPDSQVLAEDENFDPILNADSLQGSMQFGAKANIDFREVKPWLGGTDLHFGYFGINSLDAGTRVDALQVRSIFFQAYPQNPPPSFDFTYSSNLYSGEANLKFASRSRVRPIAGLRFFKLEDTYDVFRNSSGPLIGFRSLTNNTLFGGQIGLEGELWRTRRVHLYGFGKVAAMHNEVEGSATAQNAYREFSDSTYTTLVDAGTGAEILVAGPLAFRVGYRSLFASDVALGIDQNGSIPIFPGPARSNSIHSTGTVST